MNWKRKFYLCSTDCILSAEHNEMIRNMYGKVLDNYSITYPEDDMKFPVIEIDPRNILTLAEELVRPLILHPLIDQDTECDSEYPTLEIYDGYRE